MHEISSVCIKAVEVLQSREAAQNRESVAHKKGYFVEQICKKIHVNIIQFQKHLHFNQTQQISDFIWLNKLDEAKGLYHGNTYNNQKGRNNIS